ncbi:MAG: DUF3098 domain-containing protein [Bacteroidia bacterium]|nr:DUF3098 domain-containing protein [Bacteroidia bacterium]MDW8014714.1 DUF3098 domain-containing protein [Bacteroidia bacterium]
MSRKQHTESSSRKFPSKSPTPDMPFHRGNYRWLMGGILLLLMGYSGLLIPNEFVDSKQFSISLYVAPWLILGGFLALIYAILKK